MADALYNSAIFPTSKFLAGIQGYPVDGGLDPLAYLIGQAHAAGIAVYAWVNPFRVQNGSTDVSTLAPSNPARLHPDWTVPYADGNLYFNPGIPEVRQLVTDGVAEIAQNYAVDGITFDDYFYPYPVSGATFDDAAQYKQYGGSFSNVGDWRRDNVNQTVQSCYNAIKAINPNCQFGIAPFGIWNNQSASTKGSATNGLSSYSAIYADSLAWIDGGYVDFICPEIYWAFSTSVAPYDVLVRWWSMRVDEAEALSGKQIALYIANAAYKVNDFGSDELCQQVQYGRAYANVMGNVMYGYQNLVNNDQSLADKLTALYSTPLTYTSPVPTGAGIAFGRPAANTTTTSANFTLMGSSDPAYPVKFNGDYVPRSKNGLFDIWLSLDNGKNSFVFSQNGVKYTYTITRSTPPANAGAYAYPQMSSYSIIVSAPVNDYIIGPGEKISVKLQAPSKSSVYAYLGSQSVKLTPTTLPPDQGTYMTEFYTGTITLPSTVSSVTDLGRITYSATRDAGESASAVGVDVTVLPKGQVIAAETLHDNTPLKITPTSSFYDDYKSIEAGMRDYVTRLQDGYYTLRCGAYVAQGDMRLLPGRTLNGNAVSTAVMEDRGSVTEIRLGMNENTPYTAYVDGGKFVVTLFNTYGAWAPDINVVRNPLFKSVTKSGSTANNTITYTFTLVDPSNWYGFQDSYNSNSLIIDARNPRTLDMATATPLAGMTIYIDAGHGGDDPGALSFWGTNKPTEADFTLQTALQVQKQLQALGATVVMTRTDDSSVDIYTRMDTLDALNPDLAISIHYNSLADTQNTTRTRGLLGLYCNQDGLLLSTCLSQSVCADTARMMRTPSYQALAMCRNFKFPSALIEVGFMTSVEEVDFALSPANIAQTAKGFADGVLNYFAAQAQWAE